MTRQQLERHQVWIYAAALAVGLAAGGTWPAVRVPAAALLWPALVLLLYVTFVQVPLLALRAALADRRFACAVAGGNFLVVPLLVAGLLALLPDDPALRLGVALVLLVPCTDWFIGFAALGGGDPARAIAVTPLNLLLQLLLLPAWLWLLVPGALASLLPAGAMASAGLVVALPLLAALVTARTVRRRPRHAGLVDALGAWPVPLLALVLGLVATSQAPVLVHAGGALQAVVPLFVVYLAVVPPVAKAWVRLCGLPPRQARTLCFSLGTRNSFLVLPLALAVPEGAAVVAAVVVAQSLVELTGMLAYLRVVPRLFAEECPPGPDRGD